MAHDNPLRIPEALRHDAGEIFKLTDPFCAAFNGIGYALEVEMLDEVTRAAWKDAEALKKAAAKRPLRQKATR